MRMTSHASSNSIWMSKLTAFAESPRLGQRCGSRAAPSSVIYVELMIFLMATSISGVVDEGRLEFEKVWVLKENDTATAWPRPPCRASFRRTAAAIASYALDRNSQRSRRHREW